MESLLISHDADLAIVSSFLSSILYPVSLYQTISHNGRRSRESATPGTKCVGGISRRGAARPGLMHNTPKPWWDFFIFIPSSLIRSCPSPRQVVLAEWRSHDRPRLSLSQLAHEGRREPQRRRVPWSQDHHVAHGIQAPESARAAGYQ